MRKQYVLGMALIAALSLGSCSDDSTINHGLGNESELLQQDGQVLTLCVDNGGDGLAARAGRPLLSSAARQDINNIVLYVVNDKSKVILKKVITADQWKSASDYANGKQIQVTFRASEGTKLDAGKYTMYAIGYNTTDSKYTFNKFEGVTGQVNNNSDVAFENLYAILDTPATNAAEEIFAGQVSVTAVVDNDAKKNYLVAQGGSADKKEVPTLILNRQVAGVTGYFSNLPAKVGEQNPAKLRLVASGKSDKVFFTSLLNAETDTDDKKAQTNVINGTKTTAVLDANTPYFDQSKKGYVVYEIALSSFFPQLKDNKNFAALDLDKDGYVGYKDAQHYVYDGNIPTPEEMKKTWADDIQGKNNKKALKNFWKNPQTHQTLVAGSVFAGRFIIPFALTSGTSTFELQLVDAKDNILKTWNVQVDNTVSNPTIAEGITGTATKDNKLVYNIYRNHMYSMGVKANDPNFRNTFVKC